MPGDHPGDTIRVWDRPVRVLHWTLALTVMAGWLTRHGFGFTHELIGYAALGVVILRTAWGFGTSPYARFAQFVRAPGIVLGYAAKVPSGAQPRYIGHNPLGGWMAVLLLTLVFAVCATGWLYTTDRFWGVEWVEDLHDGLTNVLLACVLVHVLGVIVASRHAGENLVLSMFHGRKRPPSDRDVA